jgi:hypothetical protein
MGTLRVCLVVSLWCVVSCGGGARPPAALSSSWVAPTILAQVPAETPYLVASLAPISDRQRQLMLRSLSKRVTEMLQHAGELRTEADKEGLGPLVRGALSVARELRGIAPARWWHELGFAPGARFVLYGLSAWPVVRVEVADPARLRGVIARAIAASGAQPAQGTLDGHPYWTTTNGEFSMIAAVLDREAVIAMLPTTAIATALPDVLAIRAPAHSLGASPLPAELLGRHHLLGALLGYVDLHRLADLVTTATPTPLEAPFRAPLGPIPGACRAELDRLVGLAPRIVFGYHRLDDVGFEAVGVVETPASVVSSLRRLRTPVPEVVSPFPGRPLLAFGSAFQPEALVDWLRGVTGQLRDRPFTCPWFAAINEAGSALDAKLAAPLPALVRGMRGVAVVVRDLTISPFHIDGHVLLTGSTASLLTSISAMVPALSAVGLKPDGRPVALPTQPFHLPIPSLSLAMTPDRLLVTTGDEQLAAEQLAAPVPPSSPLLTLALDGPRIEALLASTGRGADDSFEDLGQVSMGLDVVDQGIAFTMSSAWRDAEPAGPLPAAPPAAP